jgi:trans-aconitate methyltransferase
VSFDAVAPWYRTLETIAFGNALQRARVACLAEVGRCRRAVIAGEGNGRFLAALLQSQPLIQVDCVDNSQRMLDRARQLVMETNPNQLDQVTFHRSDIATWSPHDRYDLIVTHFFLDCFRTREVGGIVAQLAQAAAPNATWLLADFRIPERAFARMHARAWLALMYRFFRCVADIDARQLIDPSPFLRVEGFKLERQLLFRFGMLKSELWRRGL